MSGTNISWQELRRRLGGCAEEDASSSEAPPEASPESSPEAPPDDAMAEAPIPDDALVGAPPEDAIMAESPPDDALLEAPLEDALIVRKSRQRKKTMNDPYSAICFSTRILYST